MRTMGGYLFWAGGFVKYNKPPLSVDAQIRQLQQRGMLIDDHALASHYLQHLNYYRLAGYWLPFEADHNTHPFKQDTIFAQILSLYVFDRQLRLLIREFTFTFKIPRKRPADLLSVFNLQASRKIYNTLVMSAWLMDKACPENHFRQYLVELLKQHSIDEKAMGFPKQWRELDFWKTGERV